MVDENNIEASPTAELVKAFEGSEIINEIQVSVNVNGDPYYVITEEHSISDIRRWLIANDWMEDLLTIHELDTEEITR